MNHLISFSLQIPKIVMQLIDRFALFGASKLRKRGERIDLLLSWHVTSNAHADLIINVKHPPNNHFEEAFGVGPRAYQASNGVMEVSTLRVRKTIIVNRLALGLLLATHLTLALGCGVEDLAWTPATEQFEFGKRATHKTVAKRMLSVGVAILHLSEQRPEIPAAYQISGLLEVVYPSYDYIVSRCDDSCIRLPARRVNAHQSFNLISIKRVLAYYGSRTIAEYLSRGLAHVLDMQDYLSVLVVCIYNSGYDESGTQALGEISVAEFQALTKRPPLSQCDADVNHRRNGDHDRGMMSEPSPDAYLTVACVFWIAATAAFCKRTSIDLYRQAWSRRRAGAMTAFGVALLIAGFVCFYRADAILRASVVSDLTHCAGACELA